MSFKGKVRPNKWKFQLSYLQEIKRLCVLSANLCATSTNTKHSINLSFILHRTTQLTKQQVSTWNGTWFIVCQTVWNLFEHHFFFFPKENSVVNVSMIALFIVIWKRRNIISFENEFLPRNSHQYVFSNSVLQTRVSVI